MTRYLLFAQLSYAFEILRPLQREIRRRGEQAAWFLNDLDSDRLTEDERLLTDVDEVRAYDPLAVYAPGNWVPDFFPGVKVQIFHGLANDRTGKKGHYRIRELFDLYCTYSRETTTNFERLARRHGTFRVAETGWPKLDPLFWEESSGASSLRERLGTSRPIVLYASTFSPSLTSATHLFETIERLSGSGEWSWLVTLHPKTQPYVISRYKRMQSPNLTFVDSGDGVLPLLKAADVMICDTSSICLEFMLLDRPLVTFRTKAPGPHVIDVGRPEEIRPAVGRALGRPEPLMHAAREYIDELHPYRDGESSRRVLDATHDFIHANAGTLRPKPLNLWRKLKIRAAMNYYHLR